MLLFDTIDEIGVRDGANVEVRGHDFAPSFSVWTTIEECLNPPVIWQRVRMVTTETFPEPETFVFPDAIGPIECANVQHEEVLSVPRWLDCTRGPSRTGSAASSSTCSRPCTCWGSNLGDRMVGKTCAGTWVRGTKDGRPREVYLYQVADNEVCNARLRRAGGRVGASASSDRRCSTPISSWTGWPRSLPGGSRRTPRGVRAPPDPERSGRDTGPVTSCDGAGARGMGLRLPARAGLPADAPRGAANGNRRRPHERRQDREAEGDESACEGDEARDPGDAAHVLRIDVPRSGGVEPGGVISA
jgi:hypothetical protein